jgi:hypothetical protein
MRVRSLLILATMLLGVMMLSGVALAVTKTCTTDPCEGTNGPDRLTGTSAENQIYGLGGPDYINGKAAADKLYGGRGQDEVRGKGGRDYISGGRVTDDLFGGRGSDTIKAQDGYKDYIDCGLGDDTAYVDADLDTWVNCENVRPSDGTPKGVDAVFGTGRLGAEFGSPQLHVKAKSTGTTPNDAQGRFLIKYPDDTRIRGPIRCLAITGNEARLVGRIESASGPRQENGTFEKGGYVRIGVRDAGDKDQANFSRSEQTFTSCNGENPNLEVVEGNFVVKDI